MAHLLGVENLRLTVGSRLLLDEVTLGLEDGTRVGVSHALDPDLEAASANLLADRGHRLGVQQRAVHDAQDSQFGVKGHGHGDGDSDLLGAGGLGEGHSPIGDARVIESQALHGEFRGGQRPGLGGVNGGDAVGQILVPPAEGGDFCRPGARRVVGADTAVLVLHGAEPLLNGGDIDRIAGPGERAFRIVEVRPGAGDLAPGVRQCALEPGDRVQGGGQVVLRVAPGAVEDVEGAVVLLGPAEFNEDVGHGRLPLGEVLIDGDFAQGLAPAAHLGALGVQGRALRLQLVQVHIQVHQVEQRLTLLAGGQARERQRVEGQRPHQAVEDRLRTGVAGAVGGLHTQSGLARRAPRTGDPQVAQIECHGRVVLAVADGAGDRPGGLPAAQGQPDRVQDGGLALSVAPADNLDRGVGSDGHGPQPFHVLGVQFDDSHDASSRRGSARPFGRTTGGGRRRSARAEPRTVNAGLDAGGPVRSGESPPHRKRA